MAVSVDGRRWVLLNASPDMRQQILDNPPLQPQGSHRDSPIAGVVLTNADVDHVAGLLTLRERQPLAVYGSARVLDTLMANPIFAVLDREKVTFTALPLGQPAELPGHGGLSVELFAVPGKVALWMEDGPSPADMEDTVGLILRDGGGGSVAYVPACAAVTADLRQRVTGASLLLFDGTLWRDDEILAAGVGDKTGARMGHISISGAGGTLAAWADVPVARKMLIHLNNTNPVLMAGSAELAEVRAAGWEVALDGQEVQA